MSFKKNIKRIFAFFNFKITRNVERGNLKIENSVLPSIDIYKGNVKSPFDEVPFAGEAIQQLIENHSFHSVLDIGSGEGKHSDLFKKFDKDVTSIDFGKSVYFEKRSDNHVCIFADYYNFKFDNEFDAIWASHVLEHQPNPNQFLKKIHQDLKEGGVLALTVPPLKNEIVGGHVTLWNAGLLMYQLILAGFNCKHISIKTYGYNISIILKKISIVEFPELSYDKGDIIKLKEFFPDFVDEPFSGEIISYNWKV
jgi:SAM-dependent methyltransferase